MNGLIIFSASYLYLLIIAVALLIFIFSSNTIKMKIIKLSIFTLPLSLILGKVANKLYFDPRPFVIEHVKPLIHASTDNGFPSDHTLLAMTVALIIFSYSKRSGIFLILLTLLVGIGRVLSLAHHPIDIAGSILFAGLATYISYKYLVDILNKKFK